MESPLDCPVDQIGNTAAVRAPLTAVAEIHLAFLSRLHSAAEAEGITCLASVWNNWQASYPFKCCYGHQFCAVLHLLFTIEFPADCRNTERLAKLRHVAKAKGGQCLETAWQGGGVRHRFQCARGHVWQAMPSKVTSEGSWCRRCAQQDHSMKRMRKDGLASLQDVAQRRGGKLLDTVYSGMCVRYRFSCAEGHHWRAEGADIVRGSWCRVCAIADKRVQYRLPDGLARLQAAAQAKQGICLSPAYNMVRSRYQFRCQKGHEWHATG